MNIINPQLSTNTLRILPRSYDQSVDITVNIVNEESKAVQSLTASSHSLIKNELNVLFDLEVSEGQRYSFKLLQGALEIFRGQILCTSFNDEDYTINNNEFTVDTDTDSEEFKVYE